MKDHSGLYSHYDLALPALVRCKKDASSDAVGTHGRGNFAGNDSGFAPRRSGAPDHNTSLAGVSVGTLYQYYPNKQALLHAVLKRHLGHVTDAVESACEANHHKPLRNMVEVVVQSFVNAKLEDRDASVALYAVASELDGEAVVARLSKKAVTAILAMLKTAPGIRLSQPEFSAFMLLSSMAGATRAVLEAGGSHKMVEDLRRHLVLLGDSYLHAAKAGRE
jgi:AcrR family transcriptional regulator